MKNEILKEIVPLTQYDCFTIYKRVKSNFDFPLHYHEEYELNFIHNGTGAKRMVGDHIDEISEWELVLVGSNLPHGWFTHNCKSKKIEEITIQFHRDLFEEKFLKRNQMSFIKKLLERSMHGVLFSKEITKRIAPRLYDLADKSGFDSILELMSVLHDLSTSRNMHTLSMNTFSQALEVDDFHSRRIQKVMDFINDNFGNPIGLGDVAKMANMSKVAFSRFFKQKTGYNFIDSLLEIRLGHASRMLIDTTHSVTEIAYDCGFNNISNFNRIFKKKKGCTPKEFRLEYLATGKRTFI